MVETRILIDRDVQRLLDENGLDLVSELRRLGLAQASTFVPALQPDGTRELVTAIIVGSGVTTALICAGIAKVIRALNERPFLVREVTAAPRLLPDGSPVLDKIGAPILDWREITRIDRPVATETKSHVETTLPLGIRVSFDDTSSTSRDPDS